MELAPALLAYPKRADFGCLQEPGERLVRIRAYQGTYQGTYQSVVTGKASNAGSSVTSTAPSKAACAASIRSNGSRFSISNEPASKLCSTEIGRGSARRSLMVAENRSKIASPSGSFPRRCFVDTSHADAADTKTEFERLSIASIASELKRAEPTARQRNVCVSSSSFNAPRPPIRCRSAPQRRAHQAPSRAKLP